MSKYVSTLYRIDEESEENVDNEFSDAEEKEPTRHYRSKSIQVQLGQSFTNLAICKQTASDDEEYDYSSEEEDDYLYEDEGLVYHLKAKKNFNRSGANRRMRRSKRSNYQPSDNLPKKYLNKADPDDKALENLHYRTLMGMAKDLTPQKTPTHLEGHFGDSSEEWGKKNAEEEIKTSKFVVSARARGESRMMRKARKNIVKAKQAERRQLKHENLFKVRK